MATWRWALGIVLLTVACSGGGDHGGSPSPTSTTGPAPPTTTEATTTTEGLPAHCATTTTDPAQGPVVAEPEVRRELLAMARQDQEERTGSCLPPGTRLGPTQDHTRARRLGEIIDAIGWPTIDRVGRDGAEAAWLIAQHADGDVELQERALALLTQAVAAGQGDPGDLAYLTDRVAVNRGEPQTYGSQVTCTGGRPAPSTPIVDPGNVDQARAAVGLGTLDAYYDELAMMCAGEEAEGVTAGG